MDINRLLLIIGSIWLSQSELISNEYKRNFGNILLLASIILGIIKIVLVIKGA